MQAQAVCPRIVGLSGKVSEAMAMTAGETPRLKRTLQLAPAPAIAWAGELPAPTAEMRDRRLQANYIALAA